jgi:UDP-glucose:O-linked fucose beta-1,3-glucosyltransferase
LYKSVEFVIVSATNLFPFYSVARLQQLLSCFNSSKPFAIGERYGYNVQRSPQGYNYITGGGGMVFSMATVHQIAASSYCKCPSDSTPDDMFLGICLARLGITLTHSPLFHQVCSVAV